MSAVDNGPEADRARLAREVFKVMTFMLSAAKLLADEPKDYGPFRLIDAAGRLADALERCGFADEAIKAVGREIEREKYYGLNDEGEIRVYLDRILALMADHLADA